MTTSRRLLVWISLVLIHPAVGQPLPSLFLITAQTPTEVDLWDNPTAGFLEDSTRHLPLQTVLSRFRTGQFRPTCQQDRHRGFSQADFWVGLRVRRADPARSWIIGSDYDLIDSLDCYILDEQTGRLSRQTVGKLTPQSGQVIHTHARVIPLVLNPNQPYTLLFRYAGRDSKILDLSLLETHTFYRGQHWRTWVWAPYAGFFLTMILVQLVFFSITRNRNVLFYLLYLLAYSMVELNRGNGMVPERYWWPEAIWLKQNILLLAAPVAIFFGILFYMNGLKLRQTHPWLFRLLWLDAGLAGLLSVQALLSPESHNITRQILGLAITSDTLVLLACFVRWRDGYPPARFYLLGTLAFLTSILTTLFWHLGLIPTGLLTNQALSIGSMLEMLFFTAALADEYRLDGRQREQAQQRLIETLQHRNAEVSEALLQGQTLERRRVAADLHDNLGTTLSALHWNLEAIDKTQLTAVEQAVYATISQQVGQAYTDVRLLSHNLLPNELAKQGLAVALQKLTDKMNGSTPVRFRLTGADSLPRLDRQTEFELYSICLELINNTIKHARATEGYIDLSQTNGTLRLTIGDNGTGLDNQRSDGRGLQNIAARVDSVTGTWTVDSTPGGGVQNRISVPVNVPVRPV